MDRSAGEPGRSLSQLLLLHVDHLQVGLDHVEDFSASIRGGFTREGLSEPDPAGPREAGREGGGEQTVITYASVFGL